MSDALRAEITDFLDNQAAMTIATTATNVPWATSVFYARDDDLNLYFLSSPTTRHSTNIGGNANVAVTIIGDEKDWQKVRGVQVEATAAQVAPSELSSAADIYFGRFPVFRDMVGAPEGADEEALVAAMQYVHFYKITPRMIRMIDNGKGFAHKEELVLS
jgi:uncharacterized protein YhbP (UPF0306 family)